MELKFSVPKELEEEIKELREIDVSLFITRTVKEEFERLARLKRIVAKSKLTEEDVKELSEKVDSPLSQRFMESL